MLHQVGIISKDCQMGLGWEEHVAGTDFFLATVVVSILAKTNTAVASGTATGHLGRPSLVTWLLAERKDQISSP